MTVYTPTYRITIAGTVQTSTTLENATVTYGRNDFFEATQPSYCNLELLNLDGTSPVVELLDTILIEVTNSAGTYVKLFTGEVSGVYNRFAGAGLAGKPNTLQIQDVDIWFKKNGSDVAGSNSKFSVEGKNTIWV